MNRPLTFSNYCFEPNRCHLDSRLLTWRSLPCYWRLCGPPTRAVEGKQCPLLLLFSIETIQAYKLAGLCNICWYVYILNQCLGKESFKLARLQDRTVSYLFAVKLATFCWHKRKIPDELREKNMSHQECGYWMTKVVVLSAKHSKTI